MISEKESYEEIGTGSIYNETTIADQIHTKWAGKTVHFARETDSTNLWIKRLAKEEEDLADPGRYQRVRRL